MRAAIRSHGQYRWYALAVIMLGSTMGTLDASIANVALPTISRAYHHSVDDTEWVILSFMLVTASTLVVFGRLGDIFGQKRIYLGGFAIFGASSIACAFAPSLAWMIAARAVQALGAAMLLSSNQALIVDTFPSTERGRAIGFNGAAVAVGLSLGPIVGGAIVTFGDWRWIFLINVPISIARAHRRDPRAQTCSTTQRRPRPNRRCALGHYALFSIACALAFAHLGLGLTARPSACLRSGS